MLVFREHLTLFYLLEGFRRTVVDRAEESSFQHVDREADRGRDDGIKAVLIPRIFGVPSFADDLSVSDGEDVQTASFIGPTPKKELRDVMVLHPVNLPGR